MEEDQDEEYEVQGEDSSGGEEGERRVVAAGGPKRKRGRDLSYIGSKVALQHMLKSREDLAVETMVSGTARTLTSHPARDPDALRQLLADAPPPTEQSPRAPKTKRGKRTAAKVSYSPQDASSSEI